MTDKKSNICIMQKLLQTDKQKKKLNRKIGKEIE